MIELLEELSKEIKSKWFIYYECGEYSFIYRKKPDKNYEENYNKIKELERKCVEINPEMYEAFLQTTYENQEM